MEEYEVYPFSLWLHCVLLAFLHVVLTARVWCSASAKTPVLHLPQMDLSIPKSLLTVHFPCCKSVYMPPSSFCLQVAGTPLHQPIPAYMASYTPRLPLEINFAMIYPQMPYLCSIPFPWAVPVQTAPKVGWLLCSPADEEMEACAHTSVASGEPRLNPACFYIVAPLSGLKEIEMEWGKDSRLRIGKGHLNFST